MYDSATYSMTIMNNDKTPNLLHCEIKYGKSKMKKWNTINWTIYQVLDGRSNSYLIKSKKKKKDERC